MLTIEKVYDAQKALKGVTRVTDVIYSPSLSKSCGCELYLKSENLQLTGSFKIRGAYYKISRLSESEKSVGVIACSAGNHAQGVALASKKFGLKAKICMPKSAPISKIEATKSYGAEVILVDGVYDDAHDEAERLKTKHGYTFIHPFDDEDVIAGQGTVGLEILDQLDKVDAVVIPIGGGGLASGAAFALKTLKPEIKIYGVQSEGAPSMANSVRDRHIEILGSVSTVADGIAVKEPGSLTFELCSSYIDEIVTVTDEQVSAAILALIEKQKMIAEGAGAVSLAAVVFGKIPDIAGKNVCCVISGGNIDVNILSRIINRGLLISGRRCTITMELQDKPGQLVEVLAAVAECGGNITEVLHERLHHKADINGCHLRIQLETRNFEHIKQIKAALKKRGFRLI